MLEDLGTRDLEDLKEDRDGVVGYPVVDFEREFRV